MKSIGIMLSRHYELGIMLSRHSELGIHDIDIRELGIMLLSPVKQALSHVFYLLFTDGGLTNQKSSNISAQCKEGKKFS